MDSMGGLQLGTEVEECEGKIYFMKSTEHLYITYHECWKICVEHFFHSFFHFTVDCDGLYG